MLFFIYAVVGMQVCTLSNESEVFLSLLHSDA